MCIHVHIRSVVSNPFTTPWTAARQGPLSMEFFRQNIGVGFHFLLQGIFPTQGLNLGLLCFWHCRWILYHKRHLRGFVARRCIKRSNSEHWMKQRADLVNAVRCGLQGVECTIRQWGTWNPAEHRSCNNGIGNAERECRSAQ